MWGYTSDKDWEQFRGSFLCLEHAIRAADLELHEDTDYLGMEEGERAYKDFWFVEYEGTDADPTRIIQKVQKELWTEKESFNPQEEYGTFGRNV